MKIQPCKLLLILVVISAYTLFCESLTTDTTFVKKVRGVGELIQTIQAADGTYVSLSQKGGRNFIARKIRTTGQKVWERTISFPTELLYSFDAIAEISDGGYILAGGRCLDCYYGYDYVGILVKLRSNGSLEWKKEYDGFDSYYSFTSVVPVPGGGFVATSGFHFDRRERMQDLVKFTAKGNVVWIKSFIDSGSEAYKLIAGSGQGFMLSSRTSNGANVLKLNDSGSIVWKKSLEIPDFVFRTAGVTSDNGLLLAGYCSESVCNRLSLVRLKADGTFGWKAKYSLQAPNIHSITDLIQTLDGGYAITGAMGGPRGQNAKAFLLKIDSSRKVIFQRAFKTGKVGGGSVFTTSNGGYLLFRPMGQDMFISSVDSNGTTTGCNLFYSTTALSIPFGQLKVKQPAARVLSSDRLGISDIAARSVASNHPESTDCP